MSNPGQARRTRSLALLLAIAAAVATATITQASTVTLKDGRRLEGRIGNTTGMVDNPLDDTSGDPPAIAFIDNDLTRRFFPTVQIRSIDEVNRGEIPERIRVDQYVATAGGKVSRVGAIVKATPFDNYGRRTLTMATDKGLRDVVQGITLITPVWTKVEGLMTKQLQPVIWDMRIATSSIPAETLHAILVNNTNRMKLDERLRVVRLLLHAERYGDAQKELEGVLADFAGAKLPNRDELTQQVHALRQLHTGSILKEIGVRRDAGQHAFAFTLLEQFPTKDVAGETLQQVREMLEEYRSAKAKRDRIVGELETHVAALADKNQQEACQAMVKEIAAEMSMGTLDRMAAYLRLSDDKSMSGDQKVALAISGWLLGADYADTNLPVALSLVKVRSLVHRYMNEPIALARSKLEAELKTMEGAAPLLVARLIAHMKPPLDTSQAAMKAPGYYELTVPVGIDREPDVTYQVQLPPEYDPYVRYPTVVALGGQGTTAEVEIDWWAGARGENGQRFGQGTRYGTIVIAVDWLKEGQSQYNFSAREHAAVLASLRDACRRFSIDTDRVFLAGHSIGGEAAWDIGLAHPDLWAGVIPIGAQARKYCTLYSQNARLLPFYIVLGELDGDKLKDNATDLNRYMHRRYDVTVVEYQGRGHESFYEDILNIFDWMARRPPRNFFPKEFEVATLRSWDNFFWWLEVTKRPPRAVVDPVNWPPARGVRPLELKAKVQANGDIVVTTGGIAATIWLAPEIVDSSRGVIDVTVGGRRQRVKVEPDVGVLLEDVRTRGDRLHPFWAKIEL